MRSNQIIIPLIICLLTAYQSQAQFFYPKKCVDPDSIFNELQRGTLNVWAGGGFRKAKTAGQHQNNWFSSVTINYVPLKFLETGVRFNKTIPAKEPYSYQHSVEYVPYARYSLFASGCFKYAFWVDASYHIDRKRTKNAVIGRDDAAAAGFGVYKTVGRFLWLQTHTEFYPGQRTARHELMLIWKMMNVSFAKKESRRVNFNVPVPTF